MGMRIQKLVAVFGADRSKGCDATGIIAGAGSDHAWPKQGQKCNDPATTRDRMAHTTSATTQ